MTDALLALKKLALVREHLERARRRRPDELAHLEADLDRQDALAMALLVAIQESIDLAFHIVADEHWGVPASYAESFRVLSERGVVAPELAERMIAATGLRNRIAHGYASVDIERLWRELPAGFAALDAYVAAISEFVARAP